MAAGEQQRRVHLVIAGRVQGVWYRGSMQHEAERLGLAGWVKNMPDGRVEAVVEGAPAQVDSLVAWCWKGPPSARVENVTVSDEPRRGSADFA